jgi:hypothetical protein
MGQNMPKYTVPKNIVKIAQRAIDYNLSFPLAQRAAYKDEGRKRVAGTGMRTARRIASGFIDEQQMILMRAWFARHGESPKESEARKDRTSKAARSWALWGGSPGERWVKSRLRQFKRTRENKKSKE